MKTALMLSVLLMTGITGCVQISGPCEISAAGMGCSAGGEITAIYPATMPAFTDTTMIYGTGIDPVTETANQLMKEENND